MPSTTYMDGVLAHYLNKIDAIQSRCEIIADLATDRENLPKVAVLSGDCIMDCERLAVHIEEVRRALKSGPPPDPAG